MSESENGGRSPRGVGFIAAAIVLGVVALLGIAWGIRQLSNDEPSPTPTPAPSSSPAVTQDDSSSPPAIAQSMCGLPEAAGVPERVSVAPATQWDYVGTTAVPTSPTLGPGAEENGVRICFQRSPEGALVMAANALGQGSTRQWGEYIVSDGAHRDELLQSFESAPSTPTTDGVRIDLVGFRLLEYTGTSATVDLAWRGTSDGRSGFMSTIYSLTWADGDWKLDSDSYPPMQTDQLVDTVGYVAWGE